MDDQAMAGMGHNAPPPYDPQVVADLETRVRELSEAGKAWLALGAIETEENAEKLNDFLSQARQAHKQIEDHRKKAKQPHLEAGAAVDSAFKALTVPLTEIGTTLKQMLGVFVEAKRVEAERQKAREREEARRKEAEAERLRKEAEEADDAIALARAEEAQKSAKKASKAAAKDAKVNVSSASGGGRTMAERVSYTAKIDGDSNARRAFGFLLADPDSREPLIAEMERLASAARRRKDGPTEINGVNFIENRSIA
ncbi:hypothetical protein PAF17_15880 [Paracoccus sp. Z330]|uniref:Uncharacterized protein n=1 Tax=Paracoccus onchidii TaxID=3017813 RepID=A0ABT4ZI30_9RHOB|nr:hypothetical protein [Paracoccus onchidii]MDB6178971.1 hypothetical protein [Paracoccus onchidii]